MFNIIIFLLGAGIMFFMALRSVLARRRLCTQGQKVTATVEGTVQSRDGGAYVLAFTTAGGSHRLQFWRWHEMRWYLWSNHKWTDGVRCYGHRFAKSCWRISQTYGGYA